MDNIVYTGLFRQLSTVLFFIVMLGSLAILFIEVLGGGTLNNGLNSLVLLGTGYCVAVLSSYHGMVRQRYYRNITNTSDDRPINSTP